MQAVNKDGTLGPVVPFEPGELENMLKTKSVDHVDVFQEQEIEHRKKLVGKKYRPSKGFKKVPAIKAKKK